MPKRPIALLITAACALLALAAAAYWPGLYGGFLFDDFANLPALGSSGPIDNWAAFFRYITSGINDPFGRPLTLLTFLLDGHDWPTDPFPFKRTSLVLHLANGVLLGLLLVQLGRRLTRDGGTVAADVAGSSHVGPAKHPGLPTWRIEAAALLGAALWLLHPLFVSTTLYVVQREAMLPATFILLGLMAWLHGREQLRSGRIGRGVLWACVGLGACTVLATFSKANGALLPLFALAIEATVLTRRPFAPGRGRSAHRAVLWILAILPSMALVAHVVKVGVAGILSGAMGIRTWTIGQRLLTEPRVLWDYLSLLWLPRPFSHGLFNDQFAASTSLLHPWTTLPAVLGVAALIAGAWWLRRHQPALALAVLFYFAGQLIESSSLPLELYFEHRNYVPALLMFWPLALWLADTRRLKAEKVALAVVLVLGLAVMTHARADLWGDARAQSLLWAHNNPASPRAQAGAAQMEIAAGHPELALRRLEPLLKAQPEQVQLAFNLIAARCATGGVTQDDLARANQAMRTAALTGTLLTSWFDRTLPTVAAGACPGLDLAAMHTLVESGLANQRFATAGPQQDLHYVLARIALLEHRPDDALADFTQALDLNARPAMALQSAATLGSAGYPALGLKLLDHYRNAQGKAPRPGFGMPRIHAWVLEHQGYWAHELAHLRGELELDAARARPNTLRPSAAQPVPREHGA